MWDPRLKYGRHIRDVPFSGRPLCKDPLCSPQKDAPVPTWQERGGWSDWERPPRNQAPPEDTAQRASGVFRFWGFWGYSCADGIGKQRR